MSTQTTAPTSPTQSAATPAGEAMAIPLADDRHSKDSAIRPFRFHASDEDLADLKRRILATRWPERELVDDGSQGVQLATMRKLADYWAGDYDWRRIEARMNGFPQFLTEIDGSTFISSTSARSIQCLPIVITPAGPVPPSSSEDHRAADRSHGLWRSAQDAFDVVIPSLPATVSQASRPPRLNPRGSLRPGSRS